MTIPSSLKDLLGQPVEVLDTPALVVDLDAANRNLQRMAGFVERRGLRLRPHAKMHKSVDFARLQMQAGAVGLCTQTVAEAEALADGGLTDLYISNQLLSPAKLARVARLAERLQASEGRLALAVDSREGIERLARAMAAVDAHIDVFVEVDIGQGRCGVAPGAPAVDLVQHLVQCIREGAPLRYAGLHAYHGAAQHLRSVPRRQAEIGAAVTRLSQTLELLRAADLAPDCVTGAGTGTFVHEAASGLWTELQPGSFLFMDADYLRNEHDAAQPRFEPALFVKSQVISVSRGHAVCDAGHKAHAIDSGLPEVMALPGQPRLTVGNGGDEHAMLYPMAEADGLPGLPGLGDTVWLIPGHCDPTINLHACMFAVSGGLASGRIEAVVPVLARGRW